MCDVIVARIVLGMWLVGVACGSPRPQWPQPQYGAPYPGAPYHGAAPPYAPQPPYPQQPPQNPWHRQYDGYNYSNPNPYQTPQPNYNAYQGGGSGAYPQIYHVGNLVIIANPVPQTQCPPVRPIIAPVQKTSPVQTDSDGDGQLDNRFGEDDALPYSDCTWAVVACCSPGYSNVRYNCFDVLGCSGYFFDVMACDPQVVASATRAANTFYSRSLNDGKSKNKNRPASGDTNKLES